MKNQTRKFDSNVRFLFTADTMIAAGGRTRPLWGELDSRGFLECGDALVLRSSPATVRRPQPARMAARRRTECAGVEPAGDAPGSPGASRRIAGCRRGRQSPLVHRIVHAGRTGAARNLGSEA